MSYEIYSDITGKRELREEKQKGSSLSKYYQSTIGGIFNLIDDCVTLGGVQTTVDYATVDISIRYGGVYAQKDGFSIYTALDGKPFLNHIVRYDDRGDLHSRKISVDETYITGDAVINHYIAVLLRAQSQGIKKFYSDINLTPGSIKIYERLKGLGRDVQGSTDNIDRRFDNGRIISKYPIYTITLNPKNE